MYKLYDRWQALASSLQFLGMANRRLQERRTGFKRKGPRGRAEDYNAVREGLRDGEVERQRRCRQLLREREEAARLLVVEDEELGV